jgi:hypothetical protein
VLISPEDGRKLDAGSPPAVSESSALAPTALSPAATAAEQRKAANYARLQQIIESAVRGDLPRDRELKYWEPRILQAEHINMVLDSIAGLTGNEIAAKYEIDHARVSVILNHPDAQVIKTTVLSMAADEITDLDTRLSNLKHEAMNVKVELMRSSRNDSVRHRAATDILEMAGYGKNKLAAGSTPSNHPAVAGPSIVLPVNVANNMFAALSESLKVAQMPYDHHLAGNQRDEVVAEHRQLSDNLQISAGHTVSESGASPAPFPGLPIEADKDERDYEVIAKKYGIVGKEAAALREALEDEKEFDRMSA